MKKWGKPVGFNGKVSHLYSVYKLHLFAWLHTHTFQHVCIFCLYIYAYLYSVLLKGHKLQLALPIVTMTAMSSRTLCTLWHT